MLMYIHELDNIIRYEVNVLCLQTSPMPVVLAIMYIDALLVFYCLYRPLLIEDIASDISG